jgi:hypothetical protein
MDHENAAGRLDVIPDRRVGRIRALARMLDSAVTIPGTQIRIGADSIIGLFPVVGDIAGAALSGYIVLASARLGAPASVVMRMLLNIAIDTVVGSVPLFGDIFDVAWRSNIRNADLLERHLGGSTDIRRTSRWIVAGVIAALLVLGLGAVTLGLMALRLLVRLAT